MFDNALVQTFYDCALQPEKFPDALQELSDRIGARGAILFDCQTLRDGKRLIGLQYASSGYAHGLVEWYIKAFTRSELRDQDMMAELSQKGHNVSLIRANKMYGDNARPGMNVRALRQMNVDERLGAVLSKEVWSCDRLGIQFNTGKPLPDPENLQAIEAMLAHLSKSLSMSRIMVRQKMVSDALLTYLNRLEIGIAVLDEKGRRAFSNAEMDRIVEDTPHFSLTNAGTYRLNGYAHKEVNDLLFAPDAHGRWGAYPRREAVFVPDQDHDGLFIEICPLQDHPDLERFKTGARLMTVLDSARVREVDAVVLGKYFPLSKSELAVAELIGAGHSNTQIAEIRGRSVETVNSQVKSVLRKTASRNRTELIKVAANLSSPPKAR